MEVDNTDLASRLITPSLGKGCEDQDLMVILQVEDIQPPVLI